MDKKRPTGPIYQPTILVVAEDARISNGYERRWQNAVSIVGTVDTIESGGQLANKLRPDLVLINLPISRINWAVIDVITKKIDSRVLVVTDDCSLELADFAKASGASGVVEEGTSTMGLLAALLHVAKGGEYWGLTWKKRVQDITSNETSDDKHDRIEKAIVRMLKAGYSDYDIAEQLSISDRQLNCKLERLCYKHDCDNRHALVVLLSEKHMAVQV